MVGVGFGAMLNSIEQLKNVERDDSSIRNLLQEPTLSPTDPRNSGKL